MAPKSAAKNQRTSKTALSGVRPDAPAWRTGKKATVSQTAARPAVKKARDAAPKAAAQASASAASQTAATPAKPQAPLTASSPAQSAVSSGTSKAHEHARQPPAHLARRLEKDLHPARPLVAFRALDVPARQQRADGHHSAQMQLYPVAAFSARRQ